MTDAAADHIATIIAGAITIVGIILTALMGGREGKKAAAAELDPIPAQAVGAGIIDRNAYMAVVEGMESIKTRLDAMDAKLGRLVELGENQDEREERERSMTSFRDEMRELVKSLSRDIADGHERRAGRRAPGS